MAHSAHHRVRLRVIGELAPSWSGVLSGLAVAAQPDGTTLVSGVLADQAAVHGLLSAIRDLGLTLISIETIGIPATATQAVAWPPDERSNDSKGD